MVLHYSTARPVVSIVTMNASKPQKASFLKLKVSKGTLVHDYSTITMSGHVNNYLSLLRDLCISKSMVDIHAHSTSEQLFPAATTSARSCSSLPPHRSPANRAATSTQPS